jgi:Tol biopolymer transport system component
MERSACREGTTLAALLLCLAASADAGAATELAAVREVIQSVDYEPWWSPDGLSFVFVSNRNGPMNVYRLGTSGGGVTRLTTHAGPDDTPAWSPDGRTIAFVSEVDGNPEIYVIAAAGSTPRRLTFDSGLDLHPTWSPDSARVLFNTSRFSTKPSEPDRIDVCEIAVTGGDREMQTSSCTPWMPHLGKLCAKRRRAEAPPDLPGVDRRATTCVRATRVHRGG